MKWKKLEDINQESKKLHCTTLKQFTKKRNNIIKFFDDYCTVASESKFTGAHGKRLKILTHKQLFQ